MGLFHKYGPDKGYVILGHATFLAYLVFTLIYFKERLLNCDAAYYTFHVINYEDFFVKHQRYISYFTQWAPLLVIKMGGSLKAALIAYSGIFGVWFYGMYLVSVHVWKNPKGGIYLALSLFLAMRYKHFAGHTEITFAIAVAAMLVIWITSNKSNLAWYTDKVDWGIKGIFIGWLYIIHPIIIVPLAIVLTVDILYHQKWKDRGHLVFLVILIASFVVRFLSVASDSYESGKISILTTARDVFSNPGDYYVFTMLGRYITNEYIPILIIFFAIMYWMISKKKFLSSTFLMLGFFALSGLIIVTYSYLRGDIFIMIDGYLGMLGMVWGFAVYLFLRTENSKTWIVFTLSILMAYSIFRVWEKKYILERRLEQYQITMSMYPDNPKLFAHLHLHDWDQFWYPYEISMETLMLSSIQGPEYSRTIFVDYDDKGHTDYIEGNDYFLNFYNKTDIQNLNKKFFRLSSDQPYFNIDRVSWK